jgi:hypothetical protein
MLTCLDSLACVPMKTCIYCKRDSNATAFEAVEHVIPQAFGTFGSETPTLDCVCDECNQHFGDSLDIYLARETVEGVVRYRKGVSSSAARPQKHLKITLDAGPETGQFAGMQVAIDGTRGELMRPLAQFQILNQRTGQTEVYSKAQIKDLKLPEDVYGRPGDESGNGTWKCNIFSASQEEHNEMVQALRSIGINFSPGTPFSLPERREPAVEDCEDNSLPVIIEGEVTDTHRRAHAKIFLNFIANFFGSEEASKPHWDFLRQFARYGNGKIKYRMIEKPFPEGQESNALHIIRESITVRIEPLGGHVVGSIQFYGNQIYQYVLRENDVLPEDHVLGYCFTNGQAPRKLFRGTVGSKSRMTAPLTPAS